MHEAGMMRDLMEKIDELAAREGGARVSKVKIWLGALSHMSAEHFRAHYRDAAGGSPAEGAALDIEVSEDLDHPNAEHVLLKSITVEG